MLLGSSSRCGECGGGCGCGCSGHGRNGRGRLYLKGDGRYRGRAGRRRGNDLRYIHVSVLLRLSSGRAGGQKSAGARGSVEPV